MNDQIEEMKRAMMRALDAQLLAEHQAGYTIVRSPLPEASDSALLCHACGAAPYVDVGPMFERDPSVMQSYFHVAKVCGPCKDDPAQIAKLGDRIAAHGKQLFEQYGDYVVVQHGPVPSA
jgi:hypothetical protein